MVVSQAILVYVNLHMYKDSHVFAPCLTLSIPDIVLSAPSVADSTRARVMIIYNLFYGLISLLS